MKGFIISACTFLALILIITFNYIYVQNITDELENAVFLLDDVPSMENCERIEKINKLFEKNVSFISISVGFQIIDEVLNEIDSIRIYNTENNVDEFKYQVSMLINSIDNIRRLESFSPRNVL